MEKQNKIKNILKVPVVTEEEMKEYYASKIPYPLTTYKVNRYAEKHGFIKCKKIINGAIYKYYVRTQTK